VVTVTEHDLTVGAADGERVAWVMPTIPDDAPERRREGIARRRITATTGRCPCGAVLVMPSRRERRAAQRAGRRTVDVYVQHEPGCPAPLDGWAGDQR
jgi:hypothetical protein